MDEVDGWMGGIDGQMDGCREGKMDGKMLNGHLGA